MKLLVILCLAFTHSAIGQREKNRGPSVVFFNSRDRFPSAPAGITIEGEDKFLPARTQFISLGPESKNRPSQSEPPRSSAFAPPPQEIDGAQFAPRFRQPPRRPQHIPAPDARPVARRQRPRQPAPVQPAQAPQFVTRQRPVAPVQRARPIQAARPARRPVQVFDNSQYPYDDISEPATAPRRRPAPVPTPAPAPAPRHRPRPSAPAPRRRPRPSAPAPRRRPRPSAPAQRAPVQYVPPRQTVQQYAPPRETVQQYVPPRETVQSQPQAPKRAPARRLPAQEVRPREPAPELPLDDHPISQVTHSTQKGVLDLLNYYYDIDPNTGVLGSAGKDFPTYHKDSLKTHSFSCAGRAQGYYADVEKGCQAYYHCSDTGDLQSFLCPNGTVYNQKNFVCEWWYNVDCKTSESYYNRNEQLYLPPKEEDSSENYEDDRYDNDQEQAYAPQSQGELPQRRSRPSARRRPSQSQPQY